MTHKDPKIFEPKIITFGCRLNISESEVIREHLKASNRKNVVVLNTCAVTNEAERQSRQAVRRAKRDHPHAEIIVTGCSAQIRPDDYAQMPEVSRVIGNHEKMLKESFTLDDHPRVTVNDIMGVRETAQHLISGFESHVRAFIQIQNGCNHRCTFCTIPYGRGNNRSVPIADIVKQIQHLVGQGCKEAVLTGVDITDYGDDLPGNPSLGQLVRRILKNVPDLPRLRLSSVDPAEVDQTLFQEIAENQRIMPHFHISLQSGDDMILKRMKRRHLRGDILSFMERIHHFRPDAVFGADVIAGFPTETDAMHDNTKALLMNSDIAFLHVFPFSPKVGTPAAKMPQHSRELIKHRAAELRKIGTINLQNYLQKRVGKTEDVLMETLDEGRSEHYAKVKLHTPQTVGSLVTIKVEDTKNNTLLGDEIV